MALVGRTKCVSLRAAVRKNVDNFCGLTCQKRGMVMRHAAAEGSGVISTAWCSHVHLNKHTGVLCMSPPSKWDRRGGESQMFIVSRNGTGVQEARVTFADDSSILHARCCNHLWRYVRTVQTNRDKKKSFLVSDNASSANTCAQQQMGVYTCLEIFSAVCTVLH